MRVAMLMLLMATTGAACGGGVAERATDSGAQIHQPDAENASIQQDAQVDAPGEGGALTDAGSASTALDAEGAAVIVNSGSTNAVGFSITVTPDGHASWQNKPPRYSSGSVNALGYVPTDAGTCASGTTVLNGALTARLFNDLLAAGSLAKLRFDSCGKSVSWGTTTSLTYGGATVPDTECGSSTDAHAAALSTDVVDVEKAIAAACP